MSLDFTLADVDFLVSGQGAALLARLADADLSDKALFKLIPDLRRDYTPDETSAAIETVKLRRKAVDKFGADATHMLFTDDALQQASDPLIRGWRARDWSGATVDACCSIGTDALAFARAGNTVTGVDLDPVRVAMASYNAAALGLSDRARFVVGDVTADPLPSGDALFYDPARRDELGNRIYDVERYIPPLSWVRDWKANYAPLAVKLSPGVDTDQLQDYSGTLTFISVDGDLKEAELRLSQVDALTSHALLLTADGGEYAYHADVVAEIPPTGPPRHWLCEPDPAIIRAGYVAPLAAELGGAQLDTQIAYFATATKPETPWARAWQVLDWMPFNLKKLRAYLRERNVGTVTVKKRGSPLTPEELTRKLKLKGSESRTLVLTRRDDAPIVLICADYVP